MKYFFFAVSLNVVVLALFASLGGAHSLVMVLAGYGVLSMIQDLITLHHRARRIA